LDAKIVATTSAKLTYLLDRVLEFHQTEKIIIFYDHGDIAYWIAEGLEMLGMRFRIYANTLKPEMKSKYLKEFNETDTVQVLLMDLRQASHGLHVASASRIYIVNPIWDPNIESQAIKRAHRISQTRTVHVETLVLKDTLEDKMLKRRKEMSSDELQHAERDLLDDKAMSYIIQTERLLPLTEDEASASPAYLKEAPGFFQRRKPTASNDLKANTDAGSGSEGDISSSPSPTGVRFTRNASTPSRTHSAPLTPSPTPRKQSKRKSRDEIPWIGSDVDLSSPFNTPPKRRRLSSSSESVTEGGIVMESPRSQTPVPRSARSGSTT
jgi:superfamily II DNA/RNA helicase